MKSKIWKCIELDPCAFGIQVDGIYKESNYKDSVLKENEMFLINNRGNKQLVHKKYFTPVD